MSNEPIILPPVVIAGLYKEVVVLREQSGPAAGEREMQAMAPPTISSPKEGTPTKMAREEQADAAYKILGKNLQRVAIIVQSPGEPFLEEEQLQFLTKMLGACKLNLGDVAIVNDAAQHVEMDRLKDQLQPSKVLLFGLEPASTGLPLSFPLFKEQEYAGCTYLSAPSLASLNQPTEEGKQLKSKLWASLKKLFNV